MAAITYADVLELVDKYTAAYLGLASTPQTKAADAQALIIALADADQIGRLMKAANTFYDAVAPLKMAEQPAQGVLAALDDVCRAAGLAAVDTLDKYATYYNTGAGGPWNCLFPMDFRSLHYAGKRTYPSASNVYYEVLQAGSYGGVTFTNALAKFVVSGAGTGTTTDGVGIDSSAYAGGSPQINVTEVTGNGLVTVTGSWRKTDGTIASGDGTVTISTTGRSAITPPFSNALLLNVTGITIAAGITAGTFYIETAAPSGRSNPPT